MRAHFWPKHLYRDIDFTGHDVRHADGRQLQRFGIQPHIKAEPPQGLPPDATKCWMRPSST
jgi:hypothetical protein